MSRFSEKPVAIIGMGCRLPGADNVDEFWQLLQKYQLERVVVR